MNMPNLRDSQSASRGVRSVAGEYALGAQAVAPNAPHSASERAASLKGWQKDLIIVFLSLRSQGPAASEKNVLSQLQTDSSADDLAALDEPACPVMEPQDRPLLGTARPPVEIEDLERDLVRGQGAADGLRPVRDDRDLSPGARKRRPID